MKTFRLKLSQVDGLSLTGVVHSGRGRGGDEREGDRELGGR